MQDTTEKRREEVAVFRYGLIADVIHLQRGSQEIGERLRAKAEGTYCVPRSSRCTVAAETLRHWLKLYRRGGFEALKPRGRADTGVAHSLPREVADLLCHTKDENPAFSVQMVIARAMTSGVVPEGLPLPASTVHRLLSRAGLMRRPAPAKSDHRRFAFEQAGELWMSDVMHGPAVGVGGRVRRKAYLIAFIDDATRVVPFAAFALAENTMAFLPQLKQAILRRGIPKRLYVDNGAAYRSQHLQLVCAKLGVTLIHARPYHPEAKGKQERWFRTVRMRFLPTLTDADTKDLAALNGRLWGWVEGEYHRSPHRGLGGLTPLDAWAQRSADVVHVGGRPDIDDMFLYEQKRRVAKDRTVSVDGQSYEVDAILVGDRVTLRYEPRLGPPAVVQVFGPDGKRHGDARPVDIHVNRFVKRAGSEQTDASLRMRDFDTTEVP